MDKAKLEIDYLPAHAVFKHRDFRLYQTARFTSSVGIQMQSVAVGWQVYAITDRALDLGFVGLAIFLPAVSLTLVGGDFADRYDRRKILMAAYSIAALSSILLITLSLLNVRNVAWFYPVLALMGVAKAFSSPAGSALMPRLVPAKIFPRAVAWSSSIWQMATIAGPAIGGILYTLTLRAWTVYATTAILLAIAFYSIHAIKTSGLADHQPKMHAWHRLIAGIKYVWSRQLILGAIALDLFAVLLGGATALLPIFAKDILHVGPLGLGIMRSTPGIGAAIIAIYLAYNPIARHVGVKLFVCVFIYGLSTCMFGLSTHFSMTIFALFIIGMTDMVSVYVRHTLIQVHTADSVRGRVSAVSQVFIGASNELGEFESGLTAQWFGTIPAVLIGGVGTCLVVCLFAWRFPALRKVDRLDQPGM